MLFLELRAVCWVACAVQYSTYIATARWTCPQLSHHLISSHTYLPTHTTNMSTRSLTPTSTSPSTKLIASNIQSTQVTSTPSLPFHQLLSPFTPFINSAHPDLTQETNRLANLGPTYLFHYRHQVTKPARRQANAVV
ncbi:hypothetical protein IWZ01DRAFT_505276 [Phyllosticta capitalensis]